MLHHAVGKHYILAKKKFAAQFFYAFFRFLISACRTDDRIDAPSSSESFPILMQQQKTKNCAFFCVVVLVHVLSVG